MPRYRYHPACGEREGRPRSMAAGNTALVPTKVRQYNRGCSIPRDYRNHRETMPGTSKKTVNGRPKYQLLPDLPQEEFEALKADIAARGVQYAVIQDEQGNTLDGHQRERALAELGIKRYPITVMSGLAEEEKRHLVYSLNVKRRHLSTKQKQALVEQELKRTPDIASQWLAEILGVDTKTVQAARKRLESTLEIPVLKKLRGKDGRNRVASYTRVIANSASELRIARAIARKLPPSCNGKILDTVTASRHARRHERAEARNGRAVKRLSLDSVKLFHCPFQLLERTAAIRPGSVDLILTDIPFGKEFLPQLSDLAALAERILVKGGLFGTTLASTTFRKSSKPSEGI